MIPVITFIGHQNVGKTTLIRKVCRELLNRGKKVGVIKHSSKSRVDLDKKGSDTDLYWEEGLYEVCLLAESEIMLLTRHEKVQLEYLIFRFFSPLDVDLVICEGFKSHPTIPKIEVTRRDVSSELLLGSVSNVVAVVSDYPVGCDRCFGFDEIKEIADFIESSLVELRNRDFIEVYADGRRVPMNRFVRRLLHSTLSGMLTQLKFTEGAEYFEIKLKKSL